MLKASDTEERDAYVAAIRHVLGTGDESSSNNNTVGPAGSLRAKEPALSGNSSNGDSEHDARVAE